MLKTKSLIKLDFLVNYYVNLFVAYIVNYYVNFLINYNVALFITYIVNYYITFLVNYNVTLFVIYLVNYLSSFLFINKNIIKFAPKTYFIVKVIGVITQKGGQGKSFICSLLSKVANTRKSKVLVIDCDYPQHTIYKLRNSESDFFKKKS